MFPSLGDLPGPGIEPTSLTSPALAGGFFTTSTIWEAPYFQGQGLKVYIKYDFFFFFGMEKSSSFPTWLFPIRMSNFKPVRFFKVHKAELSLVTDLLAKVQAGASNLFSSCLYKEHLETLTMITLAF